jgi:integrase
MLLIRSGDRRSRLKLGVYPDLSLSKARDKARDLLAEARLAKTETPTVRFAEAVETFYRIHLPRMRPRSQEECRRLLERHFKPLANQKLEAIKPTHVAPIVDQLAHVPAEARNAFIYIRVFFNWCVKRGYLDQSPVSRLEAPLPSRSRERVLSDREIVSVWKACPATDYGAIVRLCVLSGQRIGQWVNFRSEFINSNQVTWPAALMKSGKSHTLPLTPMVADILRCRHDRERPFTYCLKGDYKARLDLKAGVTGWTHHDLRRTFATKLAEMGVSPHVIERILAHSTGTISGVSAIYNRFSYLPEMRSALQQWEERLSILMSVAPWGTEIVAPVRLTA